jgi:hypothetical protein
MFNTFKNCAPFKSLNNMHVRTGMPGAATAAASRLSGAKYYQRMRGKGKR